MCTRRHSTNGSSYGIQTANTLSTRQCVDQPPVLRVQKTQESSIVPHAQSHSSSTGFRREAFKMIARGITYPWTGSQSHLGMGNYPRGHVKTSRSDDSSITFTITCKFTIAPHLGDLSHLQTYYGSLSLQDSLQRKNALHISTYILGTPR